MKTSFSFGFCLNRVPSWWQKLKMFYSTPAIKFQSNVVSRSMFKFHNSKTRVASLTKMIFFKLIISCADYLITQQMGSFSFLIAHVTGGVENMNKANKAQPKRLLIQ